MDRTPIVTVLLICIHHPMGWAATTPRKDSAMEPNQFTDSERLAIGKEIYDGLLTIPEAAKKYGTNYNVARTCLRKYRRQGKLPPKRGGSHVAAKPRIAPGMDELSSMDKEQLIDEVIKARAEAERAKKGYTVKGGGAEKEFIFLGN